MDKINGKIKLLTPARQAFRICAIYFVFSALWIISSDIINIILQNDTLAEFFINSGKGLLYVTVTSTIFYFLLKKYFTSLYIADKEINLSEEKHRALTEHLDVGLIRQSADGIYLFMNLKARFMLKDIIKIDIDTDIKGMTTEDIYKEKSTSDVINKNIKYIIETGKNINRKLIFGDEFISYSTYPERSAEGEIISILTVITNETEIMKSLIKLEESEKFNSHLVNSGNVVVYIFDIMERKNIYANNALEEILGYTPKEIQKLGNRFLPEIMHPDDQKKYSEFIDLKIINLKDEEVAEFDYRMLHKEGHYCWLKSHDCVYKRDSKGLPLQILGSAIDITDLKQTQDELTRKSEYLNAVIEASPMSIFDLDHEGNVLSIWNKASEDIFGWKAEEAIGKLLPIVPHDRMNELKENLNISLSKKNINGKELLRKRKNGREISIRIYARPVIGESNNVESVLVYNEDITIQKKYEEGLKKNEEYLKLLYEASLMANNTIDIEELYKKSFEYIGKIVNVTGIVISVVTEDRKFIKYEALRVNDTDIDASKIPMMQLRPDGKGPQTRAIHSGKALIIKDLEEYVKDSKSNYYIDKDGKVTPKNEGNENISRASIIIPLKHNDEVMGVLQVQSYRTDFYTEEDLHKLEPFAFIFASAMQRTRLYQKVQDELNEKEAAFEQIRKFAKGIEHSPNSIIITNAKYEIEFVNPYFTELTGYTLEDVHGKNPNILQSGQTKKEVYEELWNTLLKGETWHGEFLNLKKTGELFWEAAAIGPITDNYGIVTHYIAIKQDITEKKKKDKELKDSLEEKEIMLKEIHHRVKNNLQVISSLLNMQVEHYKSTEVIDAINSSRNRVKAMALVHENLYKSQNITKTSIKEYLIMLAKNIYLSYGVSFERIMFSCETYGIEFGLDTTIPLGLILNEAISNALKHGFPDNAIGNINVNLSERVDTDNKKYYILRVKDNGCGLPAEFNPAQASSLGMTLLTSLAAQLEGEATINNKAGTEVIVKFKELKYKSRA